MCLSFSFLCVILNRIKEIDILNKQTEKCFQLRIQLCVIQLDTEVAVKLFCPVFLSSQQNYSARFYVLLREIVGIINLLNRAMYFYSGLLILIVNQKQEMYLERTSKSEYAQAEQNIEEELESSSGSSPREQH